MRITFAGVVFDSDERIVRRNGRLEHLSPKAFDLLALLINARPRAIRKHEIVDALWPDVIVVDANLRNLVAEIRSALGDEAARAIVTLPRVGYAFRAEPEPSPTESTCALVVNGEVHTLAAGMTFVGRATDCRVVVEASGVSRHHCRVIVGADVVIEDLGSKNGTWVNGQRVTTPAPLRHGDTIGIGTAILTVRLVYASQQTTTLVDGMPQPQSDSKSN